MVLKALDTFAKLNDEIRSRLSSDNDESVDIEFLDKNIANAFNEILKTDPRNNEEFIALCTFFIEILVPSDERTKMKSDIIERLLHLLQEDRSKIFNKVS